eukprot:gnl/TRDRNA2_/TRDRNA2_194085_c0_seq1.p1 gnl/TRDRNA2_/TRDRNA2_194085_c0~~gnl/TRDRNA2_/TRDRNA2_194085_c0_seq1.p1  ORF type:complete len:196 (-),score=41.56 gnl/TRDRNA2_/TRDRNA2_194085_c0_seq1:27-614(-)
MVWDVLRLLCLLQIGVVLVALAEGPGSDLQRELLLWARQHDGTVRQACLVAAGLAAACAAYRALSWMISVAAPEVAERDASLAIVSMLLTWVVARALNAAQALETSRRGGQATRELTEQHLRVRERIERERDELSEEVKRLKAEAEKSEKQVDAIRKQAENQADAYMRLMNENASLRNNLKDFEIVMGGERKKSV